MLPKLIKSQKKLYDKVCCQHVLYLRNLVLEKKSLKDCDHSKYWVKKRVDKGRHKTHFQITKLIVREWIKSGRREGRDGGWSYKQEYLCLLIYNCLLYTCSATFALFEKWFPGNPLPLTQSLLDALLIIKHLGHRW